MIYKVTNEKELFENPEYHIVSVEESLNLIKNEKVLQLDTETTGLDPHICKCLSLQLGTIDKRIQLVIDATTVDITLYKNKIENVLIIGQNLKFDIKIMFKYGIIIRNCYDTMIVEQLLYLGFPSFMVGANEDIIMSYCETVENCDNWEDMNSKQKSAYLEYYNPIVSDFIKNHSGVSLKALCHRYLNIEMSKEVRGQIIWRGLDTEVIKYAALDVTYIYDIMCKQINLLNQKGLIKAAKIECDFIPSCAYYEWCGIHMNVPLWQEKMRKDEEKMNMALQKLNEFVVNFGNPKFYTINTEGNLWTGFDTTPKCNINWNSPKQVIPFLTLLGFNCKGIDKKTKEEKDSLDAIVLKKQKDVNPEFYEIYLAYSEAKKVCSTYSQNYLNAINPITNRIHTVFRQLGTDTGRLACGAQQQNNDLAKLKGLPIGKQKDTNKKCAYPQVQNLPADEITRASFCAEKGNTWISCDYKGEESVLMADLSQDEAMLNVFLKGEDMHSTVAYLVFPNDIPRDTPIKEIKSKYKHLRQLAKNPEFN